MKRTTLTIVISITFLLALSALKSVEDGIPYKRIYALCLDADVSAAMDLLKTSTPLTAKDSSFKQQLEERFGFEEDRSSYVKESPIQDMLKIFKKYWRKSLLKPEENFDGELAQEMIGFLKQNYPPVKALDLNISNVGDHLSQYIQSKNLFTTATVGKTGRLMDILVWQTQKDTLYELDVNGEPLEVRVIMMEDFITLGWEEYATLGRYYPGGWTNEDGLYCVRNAYDLESENFKVSFIAHEGRHYSDFQIFPDLSSADLEYRAKLTELNLAEESLLHLIQFFITNANQESENGHSVANYRVISDLSSRLFQEEFVTDPERWENTDPDQIRKASGVLLLEDTKKRDKLH